MSEFPTLRTINCNGAERRTGKEAIFWGMNNNVPFPQANNMKKIIKLLMAGEGVLSDKEMAMKLIEVSTIRQVAYYFSALQFFKYLTHDKKFTELALKITGNEKAIKENIYKQLKDNELFKIFYDKFKILKKVDVGEIKKQLKESKPELSESTINRRSSTIKAWVEWMFIYDEENKINIL